MVLTNWCIRAGLIARWPLLAAVTKERGHLEDDRWSPVHNIWETLQHSYRRMIQKAVWIAFTVNHHALKRALSMRWILEKWVTTKANSSKPIQVRHNQGSCQILRCSSLDPFHLSLLAILQSYLTNIQISQAIIQINLPKTWFQDQNHKLKANREKLQNSRTNKSRRWWLREVAPLRSWKLKQRRHPKHRRTWLRYQKARIT